MKILVISDIHGRKDWKNNDFDKYDKIIFLGDYVDSFTISSEDILDNLNQIVELKKKNQDKIILLYGNHDLMYKFNGEDMYRCSGYRHEYALALKPIFNEKDIFQAAYQYGNTLFTHAGLNRCFFKELQKFCKEIELKDNNYAWYLNEIFKYKPNLLSTVSHYRGGWHEHGGPFWADMREFSKYTIIENLNQIVGHTPVKKIEKKLNMIFCDCFDEKFGNKEILEMEINE
jgi:predicted MPP superfamily phosphohydrolase